MPTYLRKFYYEKLVKVKKEEEKQMKKTQSKTKSVSRPNIHRK